MSTDARDVWPERALCTACGEAIDPEVYAAQSDEWPDSAQCRGCLESVRDNPQLQNLYAEIRANLTGKRRKTMWDDGTEQDRFYFAVHCINEGIAEGGSPGFHEQLSRYVALLSADERRAEPGP